MTALINFQDTFVVPFSGQNVSVVNINQLNQLHQKMMHVMYEPDIIDHNIVKRRFKIYEKKEPEKKQEGACPQTGGISAFTFINFMMGVISIAATVVNNNNNNNNVSNNVRVEFCISCCLLISRRVKKRTIFKTNLFCDQMEFLLYSLSSNF